MGFILHGLDKDSYDRKYTDMELLSRIVNYFRPYSFYMILVGLFVVIQAMFNGVVPYIFSSTIDQLQIEYENGRNLTTTSYFFWIIVILLISFSMAFISNAVASYFGAISVQSAVEDVRNDVFDALLERDMAFFGEVPTGRLVSRVTNDTQSFGQTVGLSTNLLGQVLNFVVIVGFLFYTSVRLTVVLLLFAPIIVLVALAFRKIARGVALESNRVLARVNALIQETMSGIYVAKSFRAEQTIYDEFDDMNSLSYSINLRRGLVFNSIFPILNILTALATTVIVFLGPLEVISNTLDNIPLLNLLPGSHITGGQLYLFLNGLNLFFFPLVQIASFWSQFQQGLAGAERVFSIIDTENKVIQKAKVVPSKIEGAIVFKDVSFGYKDDLLIFQNFNLKIAAGEKIAIVGHTGAGKSTLSKLIGRYYEYQSGDLFIDGIDIREIDLHYLRNRLAIINQEVFLWNASIKENILYGSGFSSIEQEEESEFQMNSQLKEYSEESIQHMTEILEKIEALDWIQNLEGGFDMVVGERGSRLSQGQRQLVQFARILMQNPSILIMDEATASVDPFTEMQIQQATDLLMSGRTSIVIAHRLSTVRNVDRIIVLKNGKIIEEGSHKQLLAQGGHYRELYDTYFRHQSLEYIEAVSEATD